MSVPPGLEQLTGPDALMFHMERRHVPMHTLKIVVLDCGRRGRPVTLDDLATAVGAHLGVVRRATQRVVAPRGFGGRPFWVEDPSFDLADHLEERWLGGDGDGRQLDDLCARLAERSLDRSRPLWAMTLVHGLAGAQQAVVVRMHHAMGDGMAALNTFLAVTTDAPEVAVPSVPRVAATAPTAQELRRMAAVAVLTRVRATGALVAAVRHSRAAGAAFEHHAALPAVLTHRTSLNTGGGPARVCASSELDLETLKRVARAHAVTVNGVLHTVIAGAMREELLSRGERVDRAAVATFGVAADTSSDRCWGNEVAPANVYLHIELADPLARLSRTSRSCSLGVDLRRRRGFDLTDQLTAWMPRLASVLACDSGVVMPRINNHITTANVAGPRTRRWCGDIEIVRWISYAVAVPPLNVNLTAYSYAGTLSIGLVATPGALPDPAAFLARLPAALAELVTHTDPPDHS